MKKYLLLIYLLALSCTVSVYADPVDSIVAKTIAKNFYNRSCPAAIEWLTLAHVKKNRDGAAVYYIFNINQDDGFVMVSADDAAFPVLGYSPTGHFAHNEVSPQFAYWVQGYEDQISYLKTNHVKANSKVKNEWQKYLEVRSITTFGVGDNQNPGGVGPLLTTEWNQSPNYNDLCPSGSVTGCVATAMAQIMRYWKYPQKGTGTVPAYTSAKNHYSLPATNLANTTYQWADMPDKLTNGSSSAEKKAVATLMYHCGIAVEMDYGFSSGAYVIALDKAVCAENAYKKYFGYDASTIKGWRRSEYPGDWVALLKIELNNGRPIQYVGYDETKGGHTWICDGFDKNDFFHMNWGWGGYQDAYYNLDALDPSNGANDNFTFNSNKQAVVGIKPTCYSAELIITNPACSNSNPSAGSQVTVSCYENNNGNANAGVHKVNVYLSKSATLSSSAATLLKQLSVASVTSQGQSSLLTSTVTVPAGISGQYYLFFVADAEEAIAECNEENNAKPISISITASNSCSTPPNDGCSGSSNATALRFDTGGACENPVSSSSCGATKSGFPDCGGTNDDDDVFFTFVPTTANAVIRVAPSSGYDAVFQLLSGLCGANMQAISPGCVNSKGIGEVETFQYNNLIPGNTYFIRVWHAGSGWGTGNFSICVYGNSCIVPSAPASLSPGSNTAPGVSVTTTTPQLSWSAASGATTYKVRIMADPYTLNGIVYASDCVTSPFTVPAGILKNGISYKWDVTALSDCNASCNNTSAGVYFSVNSSSCLAPTIQAMDISIESISPTQMTVRWSSGNGTRCIVKINSTNNFTNPINGTSPAANATYSSSGEQIVYDGNSSSTIIYGLKPGTSYCIKVFEANCSGTSSVYNTANGNNNPNCQITTTATCSAPSIPAGIISFSDVTINSMVVFWG
ncbi:MAG: Peptidase family protein, partial [Sediminibacterium sp.]|nr:Peptidase family protein [Sediminibacterium sp.]